MEIGKGWNHDPKHYRFPRTLDDHTGLIDRPPRGVRWLGRLAIVTVLLACITLISE